MKLLSRKTGIIITIVGVVVFLFNLLTMTLWEIDIDILGAMIFVLGLVLVIACGKSMKHSSKLLTRKNGVWLCIIAILMTAILAYSPIPYLNGDFGGILGLTVFVLGILFIAVRWKY